MHNEHDCKGIVISLWFYAYTWQYVKDYVYMVVCMWICIWLYAYDCCLSPAASQQCMFQQWCSRLCLHWSWQVAKSQPRKYFLPAPPIAGCNHTRRPTKRTGFDQCLVWPMPAKRVSSPSFVPFCWSNVPVINPLIIWWDDARHPKRLYYRDFDVQQIYNDTFESYWALRCSGVHLWQRFTTYIYFCFLYLFAIPAARRWSCKLQTSVASWKAPCKKRHRSGNTVRCFLFLCSEILRTLADVCHSVSVPKQRPWISEKQIDR